MKIYQLIEFDRNFPNGYMTGKIYPSRSAAVAAKKYWLDRYSDPNDFPYSNGGKTRQEKLGPIYFHVISIEVESED